MKKSILKIGSVACIFIVLLVVKQLYASLIRQQDKSVAQRIGFEETEENDESVYALDFQVVDEKGKVVRFFSYIGKPIVLNFWASWCNSCKNEMAEFQEAYKKYGDNVEFVMVNLTDGVRETQNKAEGLMESQGCTFPILFDKSSEASSIYKIWVVPTTYFINKKGEIITYMQGALSYEKLEEGIEMVQ